MKRMIFLLEFLILTGMALPKNGPPPAVSGSCPDTYSAGVAVSSDGQKWIRPRLGLLYGFNSARFIQTESGTKNRNGHTAGLFICCHINQNAAFRPEILYSQKGSKFENFQTEYRLQYLEIPLLAAFYPVRHVQIHLGPSINLFKKATSETSGGIDSSQFRRQTLGIVFGAALEYRFLFLGWRYTADLLPVFETGGSARNQVLQLNTGIIL
ncbi:PorT family protein [bacterium]|nr:PorT family protein [bacterium]